MATVVTARGGVRGGRNEQSGRIFAPLLIPFLILAAIAVYAALAPYAKTNVPPPGAHGSLVWGGAIFANERELKAWLRLHGGGSFEAWAKTHPAALSLVKPRRHHHHAALIKERRKPAPVRKVSATEAAFTTTRHHSAGIWLVVGLGLMLGLLAAIPHRVVVRAGLPLGGRERELRIAVIGAGSALLVGVIAATLMS